MTAQLSIFDCPPLELGKARAIRRATVARNIEQGLIAETPAARNTDPETSHEAIAQIQELGVRARHQRAVLEAVKRWPGSTYRELAAAIGMEPVAVMRRLGDLQGTTPPLVHKGSVRSNGGRGCSTWWPS